MTQELTPAQRLLRAIDAQAAAIEALTEEQQRDWEAWNRMADTYEELGNDSTKAQNLASGDVDVDQVVNDLTDLRSSLEG